MDIRVVLDFVPEVPKVRGIIGVEVDPQPDFDLTYVFFPNANQRIHDGQLTIIMDGGFRKQVNFAIENVQQVLDGKGDALYSRNWSRNNATTKTQSTIAEAGK